MTHKARQIAQWMQAQITKNNDLYQEDAAAQIGERFGDEHVYENENGNLAISKEVLKEFRALTDDTVVWVRSDRRWRLRESSDDKGRAADD